MRLIWCQGGNPASVRLAIEAGWWYGFRSDNNHYAERFGPVALLDSHWQAAKVDWPRHVAVAARLRPLLATVPDTMSTAEVDRTLRQAEQLAPHCATLLVVPKAADIILQIPRQIAGVPIILGYSVPTSYGGSELPLWDYLGWPIHLLGGNARRQLDCCRYLHVVSADGNLAWRLARRGIVITPSGRAGQTLRQADGQRFCGPAHLESLRRSLLNLRQFWSRHFSIDWRPASSAIQNFVQPKE